MARKAKIRVDGVDYEVAERLGYVHSIGAYGAVVLVDGVEKKVVKNSRLWRFWTPRDRVQPLIEHLAREAQRAKDEADGV